MVKYGEVMSAQPQAAQAQATRAQLEKPRSEQPQALLPSAREQLLNRIQQDIPIMARPYATLAKQVGLTEAEALAILREIKQEGILRQISAIFDTHTLSHKSSLVAA